MAHTAARRGGGRRFEGPHTLNGLTRGHRERRLHRSILPFQTQHPNWMNPVLLIFFVLHLVRFIRFTFRSLPMTMLF